MLRFARWLACVLVVLVPSVALRAGTVTSCGAQPPGQSCTATSTTLTPYPTITAEASATDASASNGGPAFGPVVAGLTFNFEVVGPDTVAVPVEVELSGYFEPPALGGWSPCLSGGEQIGAFTYECSGAQIFSPGWYPGGSAPIPPLQTGSINVPVPWIVPNEPNEVAIGAAAGAVSPSAFLPLDITAATSMQLVIDPSFPDAARYQIVIAGPSQTPEPATGVLLGAGLFALGFLRIWARRRLRSRATIPHQS